MFACPSGARLRRTALTAGLALSMLVLPAPALPAPVGSDLGATVAVDGGWVLSTADRAAAAAAPAYVGNGYVGTRVPADGAGYVAAPVPAETHIAGVYASVPDRVHGGVQAQGSVSLPGWTRLDVVVGGVRYSAAAARRYRQALDLRRGVVTTTATWSAGGRVTDLAYDVTLDRARMRIGLVRLRITPHWTGTLRVRDVLGGGVGSAAILRPVATEAGPANSVVAVRTVGSGIVVAEAARLRVPAGSAVVARAYPASMTTIRTVTIAVRAGRSYEVSKVVGFATSLDSADPTGRARRASAGAPAPDAATGILAESAAAWARLWTGDILVPGQPLLQRRIRAAMFFLLASVRSDVDRGVSPVGLSAGGYNNHVFWDAETWMYPALLAQHPGEATSIVDYRFRTLPGAQRNARRGGHAGARFAWESALTGEEVTPAWAETGRLEQHITSDVVLAQWQHFLATGDRQRLRALGWPVIRDAADFWASRARPRLDGWHIDGVEGPDEENWPVADSVYTNATAATAMRIAMRAGAALGVSTPARWPRAARGLVIQAPRPADGLPAVRPEFRGYAGQQIKQADVVLLTYPWEFTQPAAVDRANLLYYTPRYDPDGPAMTDSVNSIIAAQLGEDCSAWTYTLRSVDPFVKGPYEQFTEARSGQGVFTFLTGGGGFLQEFLYGYSGLRWRADRIRVDPALPPQLPGGVRLTGLRWRGRLFDLEIGPRLSTLTLRAGAAATVETPSARRSVAIGSPLAMPTRSTAPLADDVARCRPATASAADPSAPAAAAVDGSPVTAWTTGSDPATPSTLTVTLAATTPVARVTATWLGVRPLAPYTIEVRTGHGAWHAVTRVSASAAHVDIASFPPVAGDAVRLRIPATRSGGQNPRLAELAVAPSNEANQALSPMSPTARGSHSRYRPQPG